MNDRQYYIGLEAGIGHAIYNYLQDFHGYLCKMNGDK